MGSSAKRRTSGRGSFITESITDSSSESRESSLSSSTEVGSPTDDVKAVASSLGWPIKKTTLASSDKRAEKKSPIDDSELKRLGSKVSEANMMKERYAKLLLGEDMSGSGKGVSTALAISNAITNLCASVFGQLWRLEPLAEEKKTIWRREMEWLLCVSDHIVELIPSWQTYPDGSKLEIMTCRPRSDLFTNLPALCKLDNMLLEILDSFHSKEFWYVDEGIMGSSDGSASFRKTMQRQEEKWWLPVPRVPPGGLSESSRKQLSHTRECTNQILKASMSINSIALSDMEVPDSYLDFLPKSGRASVGDLIYRYITSDHFSSECLLDCLDLSSEHVAVEIANRIEASMYIWRRRVHPTNNPSRSTTKSSWEMVKELMLDCDKREMLAERAEGLLMSLKQRFPALTQTTLDTTKIQCNKDVGKSILESYSRVLECLAFNIVSRIDDLLYVDDLTKQSGRLSSSAVGNKKLLPYPATASSTPYKSTLSTPSFSPSSSLLVSPAAKAERTPFIRNHNKPKPPRRGLGVKRALTHYLGVDTKHNNYNNESK